ncbi:helix-turn-helix domain-containing protein [Aquabacterium sp.]|uniref:helix-turn-helix domain-containing protein n=1 Tax=Aquabacterium sp. TaxID=1872578 RepID=UPI003BB1C4CE
MSTGVIVGAGLRALRLQRSLAIEWLANVTGMTPAYIEAIEQGRVDPTLGQLDALSNILRVPFHAVVREAYAALEANHSPRVNPAFLRPQVPLPGSLTVAHLQAALDDCQAVIHMMNKSMRANVGVGLQDLIQGNNFSGLVSNVLSNSMDKCTPFKHNHHQRYPDLIETALSGAQFGLEIKTTIQVRKGGESHNGHSGWHMIACYRFTPEGDILFINAMLADLVAYGQPNADWNYVGSTRDVDTGSQRTETYNTTGTGTTKLRDGSAYFDPTSIDCSRWREARNPGAYRPSWSLFNGVPRLA